MRHSCKSTVYSNRAGFVDLFDLVERCPERTFCAPLSFSYINAIFPATWGSLRKKLNLARLLVLNPNKRDVPKSFMSSRILTESHGTVKPYLGVEEWLYQSVHVEQIQTFQDIEIEHFLLQRDCTDPR